MRVIGEILVFASFIQIAGAIPHNDSDDALALFPTTLLSSSSTSSHYKEHLHEQQQQQQQRTRQLEAQQHIENKCISKPQQVYYKTNIHMEVAGGNPQCSDDEVEWIGKLLSKRWKRRIEVDSRVSGVVFQLSNTICTLTSGDVETRKLTAKRNARRRRELTYYWYSIQDHYDGWSRTYEFNWAGIGSCRWCVHPSIYTYQNRYLRGGVGNELLPDHEEYDDEDDEKEDSGIDDGDSSWSADGGVHSSIGYNGDYETSTGTEVVGEPLQWKDQEHRREEAVQNHRDAIQFVLYEAGVSPPTRLQVLDDYSIVDLKKYQGIKLTIVAEQSPEYADVDLEWVQFDVDDTMNYRREGSMPYSIAGDRDQDGTLFPFPIIKQIGTHTITCNPQNGENHNKLGVGSTTISFLVVDSSKFDLTPDSDSKLVNILEEDLSFDLSHTINTRYFNKKNHCLKGHLMYVHVDLTDVQNTKHSCVEQ